MNSTALIYRRITDDSATGFDLVEHKGLPAIFDDAAPSDFAGFEPDRMVVVIAAPTTDEPANTLTERGRFIQQDVHIYAKRTMDNLPIDTAARRLRALFDDVPDALFVEGGKAITSTVTGPVAAPDPDPSIIGRRITLRLELQDNPA